MPHLVHETETQRQHVRMPFPAHAVVNGKSSYAVKDLSSSGIALQDVDGVWKAGQQIKVSLKFRFAAFSMLVPLEIEVQHFDAEAKILGGRFINMTPEKISIVNHLLKAYMGGDVVVVNDILSIAARDNFTVPRKQKTHAPASLDWKRQIPGLAVIAVLGVMAVWLIVSNVYQGLFFMKSADAYVAGPTIELKASANGYFTSRLTPSKKILQAGEVVGTINTDKGPAQVISPCNCYIAQNLKQDQDYINAGDSVVSLAPVKAAPWVMASVDPKNIGRLKENSRVTVSVVGSNAFYTGYIDSIRSSMTPVGPFGFQPPVQIKIIPEQPIPVNFLGRPAQVSFSVH